MLLRSQENDLHALQLNLSEVKSQLRDKSALEKRIGEMQQEVTDVSAHLKVSRRLPEIWLLFELCR